MTSDGMHESTGVEADVVAQLMQTAGRRQAPPAEAYEQTLLVATAAWERKSRHHRQRRLVGWLAASLVLVASLAWMLGQRVPDSPAQVASLERVIGSAEIAATADPAWSRLEDGTRELLRGNRIRTLEGSRIGLLLASGTSLRLAESTEIELESASRIHVVAGRVYVDTWTATTGSSGIEIVTTAGVASDVGTQFELRYRDERLRIRVRDGAVRLLTDAAAEPIDSGAGEQLVMASDGSVERSRIEPDDPEWQWAQAVAPAPDINDQPLSTLLDWVRRETGRSIRFQDPRLEQQVAQTILHGNIRHMAPLDALAVMLATTDFDHAIAEDGTIWIRSKVSTPREP